MSEKEDEVRLETEMKLSKNEQKFVKDQNIELEQKINKLVDN